MPSHANARSRKSNSSKYMPVRSTISSFSLDQLHECTLIVLATHSFYTRISYTNISLRRGRHSV